MPELKVKYDHTALPKPLCLFDSFCGGDNTFVLSTRYVIQRALEVFPWVLKTRRVFIGLEIRVDELDEAVEIFCSNLEIVSTGCRGVRIVRTASFSWSK
jgi:hypothetical protein